MYLIYHVAELRFVNRLIYAIKRIGLYTFSSAYKDITLFHEFSNNLKYSSQLRLGHLNCHSLSNQLPEISILLAQTKLSVLAQ